MNFSEYSDRIAATTSKEELLAVLEMLEQGYTAGALPIASAMTDEDYVCFMHGLALERMQWDSTDEWLASYINLLIPPAFARIMLLQREGLGILGIGEEDDDGSA